MAAFQASTGLLNRYPDGTGTILRQAIAQRFELDPSRVVCGSASDELISLLIQAYAREGDTVLYPEYGFIYYKTAALAHGARPVPAPELNFKVDVEALVRRADERTKVCFVNNPGNVTGTYLTHDELAHLRERLPKHTLLVIDSAYAEYVTVDDYSPGHELVEAREDTVMLRTFSKIYGLAGLRLGWAYCPKSITDVLNRVRSPYNVSGPAIAAGAAALADDEYVRKVCDHNSRCRERLSKDLEALGLKVQPSVSNFLLVEVPPRLGAANVANALRMQSILVRSLAGYGLNNHLRITIGTDQEIEKLLAILRKWIPDAHREYR